MVQLGFDQTPHCCRHTCISLLAEAKVSPTYQKMIVGHKGANEQLVVKKPGEWNRMIVTAKGQQIDIELNGKHIVSANLADWTSGTTNPDGTEIPEWLPIPYANMPTKGYIGLQGKHGESNILV